MKKKIFMFVMAFAIILPAAILLTACGGGKNYSVSMTIDGQYMYLDMFGFGDISFKKDDLKNSDLNLYGYNVYDYSELTVLFNGKENNEWFSKQDNSGNMQSDQIRGETIQIGTSMLRNINEDVTITITGVKEKEVSFAFMRADDERLGHADFSTTANIYSHLDYSTKLNSANTMTSVFSFSQTQENKKRNDKTYKLEQEIERLKNIIAEKEDEEYLEWKKQIKKRKKDFEM